MQALKEGIFEVTKCHDWAVMVTLDKIKEDEREKDPGGKTHEENWTFYCPARFLRIEAKSRESFLQRIKKACQCAACIVALFASLSVFEQVGEPENLFGANATAFDLVDMEIDLPRQVTKVQIEDLGHPVSLSQLKCLGLAGLSNDLSQTDQ